MKLILLLPILLISVYLTDSEALTLSCDNSSGDGVVVCTWDQELNADRYELKRSTDGISYTVIGEINSGNLNFTDTNAPNNSTVYYQLDAVDLQGPNFTLLEDDTTFTDWTGVNNCAISSNTITLTSANYATDGSICYSNGNYTFTDGVRVEFDWDYTGWFSTDDSPQIWIQQEGDDPTTYPTNGVVIDFHSGPDSDVIIIDSGVSVLVSNSNSEMTNGDEYFVTAEAYIDDSADMAYGFMGIVLDSFDGHDYKDDETTPHTEDSSTTTNPFSGNTFEIAMKPSSGGGARLTSGTIDRMKVYDIEFINADTTLTTSNTVTLDNLFEHTCINGNCSWDIVYKADSYNLLRSSDNGNSWLSVTNTTSTSHNDSGFTSGDIYLVNATENSGANYFQIFNHTTFSDWVTTDACNIVTEKITGTKSHGNGGTPTAFHTDSCRGDFRATLNDGFKISFDYDWTGQLNNADNPTIEFKPVSASLWNYEYQNSVKRYLDSMPEASSDGCMFQIQDIGAGNTRLICYDNGTQILSLDTGISCSLCHYWYDIELIHNGTGIDATVSTYTNSAKTTHVSGSPSSTSVNSVSNIFDTSYVIISSGSTGGHSREDDYTINYFDMYWGSYSDGITSFLSSTETETESMSSDVCSSESTTNFVYDWTATTTSEDLQGYGIQISEDDVTFTNVIENTFNTNTNRKIDGLNSNTSYYLQWRNVFFNGTYGDWSSSTQCTTLPSGGGGPSDPDPDPCIDLNFNGICDDVEFCIDLNFNGICDDEEGCVDLNNNGVCDYLEESPFTGIDLEAPPKTMSVAETSDGNLIVHWKGTDPLVITDIELDTTSTGLSLAFVTPITLIPDQTGRTSSLIPYTITSAPEECITIQTPNCVFVDATYEVPISIRAIDNLGELHAGAILEVDIVSGFEVAQLMALGLGVLAFAGIVARRRKKRENVSRKRTKALKKNP